MSYKQPGILRLRGWFALLLWYMLLPAQTQAEYSNPITPASPATNPQGLFEGVFSRVMTLLTAIAGGLAIVYIIVYGIQYITSAGDKEKAKKARGNIVNAVIGIVVVSASYAIVMLVIRLTGAISGDL